jgi:hypothetical protein
MCEPDSSRSGRRIFHRSPGDGAANLATGKVTPFITNLPTGDHPNEQLAFKGGWI